VCRRRLRAWLEELGHDVAEVRTVNPSMSDNEVLEWAVRENRIVITADKDFGQLAVAAKKMHSGIVRLPDVPFPERKRLLETILARHANDLEAGAIITASTTRIRVRRL